MGLERTTRRWGWNGSSLGIFTHSLEITRPCCSRRSESTHKSSMGFVNTATATRRDDGCAMG